MAMAPTKNIYVTDVHTLILGKGGGHGIKLWWGDLLLLACQSVLLSVIPTTLKLLIWISWILVCRKDIICSCAFHQEILIPYVCWSYGPWNLKKSLIMTLSVQLLWNSSPHFSGSYAPWWPFSEPLGALKTNLNFNLFLYIYLEKLTHSNFISGYFRCILNILGIVTCKKSTPFSFNWYKIALNT